MNPVDKSKRPRQTSIKNTQVLHSINNFVKILKWSNLIGATPHLDFLYVTSGESLVRSLWDKSLEVQRLPSSLSLWFCNIILGILCDRYWWLCLSWGELNCIACYKRKWWMLLFLCCLINRNLIRYSEKLCFKFNFYSCDYIFTHGWCSVFEFQSLGSITFSEWFIMKIVFTL